MALFVAIPVIYILSLAPVSASPNGKPFIELQGQILEVQADVSALDEKYEAIRTKVNNLDLNLQGQIDALNREITELREADASLQSSLSTTILQLADQGTVIEGLIKDLGDVVSEILLLQESNSDNSDAILALEQKQQEILGSLASLEPGLVAAMNDISENQALIWKLQSDVSSLEENKQNDIVGKCPESASVNEVRDDGSLVCSIPDLNGTVSSYFVLGKLAKLTNSFEIEPHCALRDPLFGLCIVVGTRESWKFTYDYSLAICPTGSTLSGGGYKILDASYNRDIHVFSSGPLHPDDEIAKKAGKVLGFEITGISWMVYARNFSEYISKQAIQATAVCLEQ